METQSSAHSKSEDTAICYSNTPDAPFLMVACAKGNLKLVKCLMEQGQADMMLKDRKKEWTCFHWAVDRNHLDVIKYLADINPKILDEKIKHGMSLLEFTFLKEYCDKSPREDIFDFLLSKGANVETGPNTGYSTISVKK